MNRFTKVILYIWIIIIILGLGGYSVINHAQNFVGPLTEEESNVLIRLELRNLLVLNPDATLVRTGLILKQQPKVANNLVPLLRFDVSNAVAIPGQTTGDLTLKNVPIDSWAPWLDNFLANKCQFVKIDEMNDASAKGRVANLGIAAMEACPFIGKDGAFLGGMFLCFPRDKKISIDINYAEKTTKATADHISHLLQLRNDERYR